MIHTKITSTKLVIPVLELVALLKRTIHNSQLPTALSKNVQLRVTVREGDTSENPLIDSLVLTWDDQSRPVDEDPSQGGSAPHTAFGCETPTLRKGVTMPALPRGD